MTYFMTFLGIIAAAVLMLTFSGCAYNSIGVTCSGWNPCYVYVKGTVDKPVDVDTSAQANLPTYGGSMTGTSNSLVDTPLTDKLLEDELTGEQP